MSSKRNASGFGTQKKRTKRNRAELDLPWLRMAGETDEGFEAFTQFRLIPYEDRSVSALLKLPAMAELAANFSTSWFYDMANRWFWNSRADAFDEWIAYSKLTKQYGRFLESLEEQASTGRSLREKASRYLLGDDVVNVEDMWLYMAPKDLIAAMRLGQQMERDALKVQREAMVGNQEFAELDELSKKLKPGSIQEQMFNAVMVEDFEQLEKLCSKVIADAESQVKGMPTQESPLDEGSREKVRLMAKKLLNGAVEAPDELIALLESDVRKGNADPTNGVVH